VEYLTGEGAKVGVPAIGTTNTSHTLGPVGATDKLFQARKNVLGRLGISLVAYERFSHYGLDNSFPMGNVSSHAYIYVAKRAFACYWKEKEENEDSSHLTTGSSGLAGQAHSQLNQILKQIQNPIRLNN
jgi:hypothetical protein